MTSPEIPDAAVEAAWAALTQKPYTREVLREALAAALPHLAGRAEPAAIAEPDDDEDRCIACDKPFKQGDMVLNDVSGGSIHVACCGPDRESYVGPGDPFPKGYAWRPALVSAPAAPAEPAPALVAAKKALLNHIATALDDIDVDARGLCKWSDVATARDIIYRAVRSAAPALVAEPAPVASEAQIRHMAERFLGWKLPENFRPDAGISFERDYNQNTPWPMKHEPTGTNLFDFEQAKGMVRYMVEGLPAAPPAGPEHVSALREAREAVAGMIRLSEMGFEESMKEPEENGNFATYTKAKAVLAKLDAALAQSAPVPATDAREG